MSIKQYTLSIQNVRTKDRDTVNVTANSIDHALTVVRQEYSGYAVSDTPVDIKPPHHYWCEIDAVNQ